jgi:hypothetical protein
MVFLYYFIGSIVLGIIPAIIAMQTKRNFFVWWLYGALFLPAALINSIFLVFKLNKGMFVVYTLIILHGISIFYVTTWFFTTQPISIQQAAISGAKYKVADLMLKNTNALVSGEIADLRSFAIKQTQLPEKDIDIALEYYDNSVVSNKDKVTAFALVMLESIYKIFEYISSKGAFEESSVPMGAASEVFRNYIDSLVLINAHLDDTPTIESNLESILNTEQMYFKTTAHSKPFLAHLDAEAAKDISRDRKLSIVDHYLSIGKILALNNQKTEAKRCNDSAIAIYDKILSEDLPLKERESFLYKTAEAHDKNGDADNVIKLFDTYLELMFSSTLYADKDTLDQVRKFVKLTTIVGTRANLVKALATFMDIYEKNKTRHRFEVAGMENEILTEIFNRLSDSERNKYATFIDGNYKILIGTGNIAALPIVQKAFNFFEDSHYLSIADQYMAIAKQLIETLLAQEDRVVADYTALEERVTEANDRASVIIETEPALSAKEIAELKQTKAAIENEVKRLEALNSTIKAGRGIIAEMIDPKASQDETFKVESRTRDAVREYNDNYSVIEGML